MNITCKTIFSYLSKFGKFKAKFCKIKILLVILLVFCYLSNLAVYAQPKKGIGAIQGIKVYTAGIVQKTDHTFFYLGYGQYLEPGFQKKTGQCDLALILNNNYLIGGSIVMSSIKKDENLLSEGGFFLGSYNSLNGNTDFITKLYIFYHAQLPDREYWLYPTFGLAVYF